MRKRRIAQLLLVALLGVASLLLMAASARATEVSIDGTKFRLDGALTYPGTAAEGLLLNSRMANAVFDDANSATVGMWKYPDTGTWDAERNTNEFVAALPTYAAKGLRAVSVNLQGGNPVPGCSCNATHEWISSAYTSDGSLKPAWMSRAGRVITAADQQGMVVILGLMYHGQDQRLADEAAVKRAVDGVVDWLLARGDKNVLLEIAGESNHALTSHAIVKSRVHELIARARLRSGGQLPVSTGFTGQFVPPDAVLSEADYVLVHANGADATSVKSFIAAIRGRAAYQAAPKPIVISEDSTSIANFDAAVAAGASWGYHDKGNNDYSTGFQTPPINWGLTTTAKRAFFDRVAHYAGTTVQRRLLLSPTELSIAATQGDPVANRSASLQSSDGSTPAYSISDDASWLGISPAGGTAPAQLTLSASSAGLAPGTYVATVTASASGYTSASLRVTLTVSPPQSSTYTLMVSGSNIRSGAVALHGETVAGQMYAFTAPDADVDEVRFFVDDPARSRTPYRLEHNAPFDLAGGTTTTANPYDTRKLADGEHTVTAELRRSSGAIDVVTAEFRVSNASRGLTFAPAALSLTAPAPGATVTASASLQTSDGGAPTVAVSDDASWLAVSPASGTAPATISLTAASAGLPPGTHTATVTATASGYTAATLSVTFTVPEATGAQLLMSTSPYRSSPVTLDGRTVSGPVYIFTGPDDGVASASFYVDDPGLAGAPYRIEANAPFDLAGGTTTVARAFNTTSLSNGDHRITAVLERADGGTETVDAVMRVAN